MNAIRNNLRKFFAPVEKLPSGIFHYQSPPDDPRNYRLHLRLETDGSGILIVNAATILHLNQTAAELAYYLVQNLSGEEVGRRMASRYHIDALQARIDYEDLSARLQTLINTPDLDPVTFLDFERQKPFTGSISAPYRLDCALTYKLPNSPEAAPAERVAQELTTAEWQTVLDKAWKAGIPQVVFTGGEPTLRPDLPDLIAHAEALGQVSGLMSDGLQLADPDYMDRLLQTGLDHLMLVLQPENELAWQALQNALAADLFVAVHLTLTPYNQNEISSLIDRLAGLGVAAVSLSASEAALAPALQSAREQVAEKNLELIWNLPVPYSALHPVALELAAEHPQGAGKAWLYVEPDGDVLPAQGVNTVMGNLLRDPWEKIWKSQA